MIICYILSSDIDILILNIDIFYSLRGGRGWAGYNSIHTQHTHTGIFFFLKKKQLDNSVAV